MMSDLQIVSVSRPSAFELHDAIYCFADENKNVSTEDSLAAMLVIVGESCSLFEEGQTRGDIVASLAKQGLEPSIAITFVDKAKETFDSNKRLHLALALDPQDGYFSTVELVILALVAAAVLAIFVF